MTTFAEATKHYLDVSRVVFTPEATAEIARRIKASGRGAQLVIIHRATADGTPTDFAAVGKSGEDVTILSEHEEPVNASHTCPPFTDCP